jgi:hypothetical protein
MKVKAVICAALLISSAATWESMKEPVEANSQRIIGGVVARSEVVVNEESLTRYNTYVLKEECPRNKSWYLIQTFRNSRGQVIERKEIYVGCDKSARVYIP